MKSRYDYMSDSKVIDDDGLNYPDPLSINYNDGTLTKIPTAYKVTTVDLAKFWLLMYNNYNITYDDDLLLNENGISYLMSLKPGDTIYLPKSDDLEGFIVTALANVQEIDND